MSGFPDARTVSFSTAGYEDGLGRRSVRFDREVGGMLECLRLRPELWAFESSLRERMAIMARLDDERFVRVREIERSPLGLVVTSELVPGQRLIDIIDARQRDDSNAFGIEAALGFLLQALPALSTLHGLPMAHGAIDPGRMIVTPGAQLVLLDCIYAPALERLGLNRAALWSGLGVLAPPSAGPVRFDAQADLIQTALCALVLTVGRQVAGGGNPALLGPVVHEVSELAEIRAGTEFAGRVKEFFAATLPLGGRRPVVSSDDAAFEAQELAEMIGEEGCHAALAELTRYEPAVQKPVGAAKPEPVMIVETIEPERTPVPEPVVDEPVEQPSAPVLVVSRPPIEPLTPATPLAPPPAPKPSIPDRPLVAASAASAPAFAFDPLPAEPPTVRLTPQIEPQLPPAAPFQAPAPVVQFPTPGSVVAFPTPAPLPTPVAFTPPPPVAPAPTPAAPPEPIRIAATQPGAPVKVRTEPPSGFAPPRPERDQAARSLPFVDRAQADERAPFPWKLAAVALIVLAIGIVAARSYLLSGPSAPETATTAAAQPAPAAAKPQAAGTTGGLSIDSQPSGATVSLDGKEIGVTPLKLDAIEAGRHTVVITTSTASVKRTVRIEAGRVANLDVPVFSGWVSIFSPITLDVSSEGKTLGTTETGKIMLPPGRHVLTLSNREFGYTDTRTVEVFPGEERALNVEPKGSVNINAHPWAEVWVDGKKAGDTPIANLQVLLGTRVFVFKHPQYGERRVTETITKAGAALSVDLTRQ